jgi:hypothetical protein
VPFFRATVYGRISVLIFFIAFAALGWTRPLLVALFAWPFLGYHHRASLVVTVLSAVQASLAKA